MSTTFILETDVETVAKCLADVVMAPDDSEAWQQLLWRLMASKDACTTRATDATDILHPSHAQQYAATLVKLIDLAGVATTPVVESRSLVSLISVLIRQDAGFVYEGDSHAFMRLALEALGKRDATPVSTRNVLKTMDRLLDPKHSFVFAVPDTYVKNLCCAAFGEIWWDLQRVADSAPFDPYRLVLERPPWQRGEFFNPGQIVGVALPHLDIG